MASVAPLVTQTSSDEREPYTAEEIEFARKIGETFGGNHVDIQDVLVRYEKSRKAAVEHQKNSYWICLMQASRYTSKQ